MMGRAQIDAGGNAVRVQGPGDGLLDQTQVASITTVGAGTLTAAAMLAGAVDRTGPTAGYTDTLDTADNLMAAAPWLNAGDSFEFLYRTTVAFATTLAASAAGTGAELSGSNTGISASSVRKYLLTVIAGGRQNVQVGSTTNGSAVLTGFTQEALKNVQVGMAVSGTGISASTHVIAVNSTAGTVTMSANATATSALPQACTFAPRYSVKGLWQGSL